MAGAVGDWLRPLELQIVAERGPAYVQGRELRQKEPGSQGVRALLDQDLE